MTPDLFVYVLMTLNACASIAYGWQGQYIKALYWLSALLLKLLCAEDERIGNYIPNFLSYMAQSMHDYTQ